MQKGGRVEHRFAKPLDVLVTPLLLMPLLRPLLVWLMLVLFLSSSTTTTMCPWLGRGVVT